MAQLPRYDGQPVALNTGFDSGAADSADKLGQIFDQFAARSNAVAAGLASQAGKAAGEQAGYAGTPQPKTGFSGLTKYGAAYNSSAEVAYMNKVQTDVMTTLDSISASSEGNPDEFDNMTAGLRDGYADVNPAYKSRIDDMLNRNIAFSRSKIVDQKVSDDRNSALASYQISVLPRVQDATRGALMLHGKAADDFITDNIADNDARLQQMVHDHVIPATEAAQASEHYKALFSNALLATKTGTVVDQLETAARSNVEAGDKMFAGFMDDHGIPQEERDAVAKEYLNRRNQLHQERAAVHAEESSKLAADIHMGLGLEGLPRARALYQAGASSVDEFQGFRGQMAENSMKNAQDGIQVARVDEFMKSSMGTTTPFDPKEPKDKESVTKWFEAKTKQAGQKPGSPEYLSSAVYVTQKTGIVPETVTSWTRRSLLSQDPTTVGNAAIMAKRLQETAPTAWEYNTDTKMNSYVAQITDNVATGMPITDAVQLAHKAVYEVDSKILDRLGARYAQDGHKISQSNDQFLARQVNSSDKFVTNKDKPWYVMSQHIKPNEQMNAEFDGLVREYYMTNNGDVESAQKQAQDHILGAWGISNMNGAPELQKFPPERYGIEPDMLLAHKISELEKVGYTGNPADAVLAPIPFDTERTSGKEWLVVNRTTNVPILNAQNLPLVMILPLGDEEAKKFKDQKDREKLQKEADDNEVRLNESAAAFDPFSKVDLSTGFRRY